MHLRHCDIQLLHLVIPSQNIFKKVNDMAA